MAEEQGQEIGNLILSGSWGFLKERKQMGRSQEGNREE